MVDAAQDIQECLFEAQPESLLIAKLLGWATAKESSLDKLGFGGVAVSFVTSRRTGGGTCFAILFLGLL